MFRKIISTILATCVCVSICSIPTNAKPKKHYRTEFAVCYDVSIKDNMTYIVTGDNNCYMFECDDSEVGDIYKVKFNTKETKTVKDDSIVAIRYINQIDSVHNVFSVPQVKTNRR